MTIKKVLQSICYKKGKVGIGSEEVENHGYRATGTFQDDDIILKINRNFKGQNENICPLCIQSLILTAP